MKILLFLLAGAAACGPLLAQGQGPGRLATTDPTPQAPSADSIVGLEDAGGEDSTGLAVSSDTPLPNDRGAARAAPQQRDTRFTLEQELSTGISTPAAVANDRTLFRLEYQKYFLQHFYLNLDTTATKFWGDDHRFRTGSSAELLLRNAFLQFSAGNTSVKLGRQLVIWGESDAGVITDVISPRDLRELFFISLEASRLSQFMLLVEQFTRFGDWSVFYVPSASFNKYPVSGDLYYINPFPGFTQRLTVGGNLQEYGLRWKKTFGNSDISVMAANLLDSNYAYREQGTAADGTSLIDGFAKRFNMVGLTFNRAMANVLFSAEIAEKSSLPYFSGTTLQNIDKNDVETSLKVQYLLGNGGDHSIGLEVVNRHVMGWTSAIAPTARDSNTLVFSWGNSFLNQNLNATWLTVFDATHTSIESSLFLDYKLTNQVGLSLDAFYLRARDRNSPLNPYDGVSRVVARVLYQFQ